MRLPARIVAVFFILFGLGMLAVAVYLGMHQDSAIVTRPREWRVVVRGNRVVARVLRRRRLPLEGPP
jgi:hypothetical protein